jgi:hypothetical protein
MEKITKFDDKCIIVKIPIGIYQRKNLYDATRRCWRINLDRARMADYVLGTFEGKVICVIKVTDCDYVNAKLCAIEKISCKNDFGVDTELCEKRGRVAFEGHEIKDDKKYLNKSIPNEYLPVQNPVKYTY